MTSVGRAWTHGHCIEIYLVPFQKDLESLKRDMKAERDCSNKAEVEMNYLVSMLSWYDASYSSR